MALIRMMAETLLVNQAPSASRSMQGTITEMQSSSVILSAISIMHWIAASLTTVSSNWHRFSRSGTKTWNFLVRVGLDHQNLLLVFAELSGDGVYNFIIFLGDEAWVSLNLPSR